MTALVQGEEMTSSSVLTLSSTPGRGEIDDFIGGAGSDRFQIYSDVPLNGGA